LGRRNIYPEAILLNFNQQIEYMLIKAYGSAVHGISATTITIEVNITNGIRFFIDGLADSAVREIQKRIESAIVNNGLDWPRTRVVVNMAPADIRKEGDALQLPTKMRFSKLLSNCEKSLFSDGYLFLNLLFI
jgi:predicted ATPase with chaperone activity